PRYGGHIERGFGTWLTRARRLKGTTFSNVEQKGDYDSEGRAIMTRAELEKWFTIYVAKVYANTFHKGIKTTPLAKYKEGVLGTDNRPGIGLPDRVAEPTAFMLDFMPFEERTIGKLRQTNIDLGLAGNARIVANAADPFDTPEQIVIRERINCVNSLAHWQIITESESIKEPRGRSRS